MKRYAGIALVILILLLTIPLAMAYSTGIPPLNQGVNMIGGLFNLEMLRENEDVQAGIIRFGLFIVLLAVFRMGLLKAGGVFDTKTANITSAVISGIGVFFMPRDWLMATGGAVTALASASIFLAIFLGISYLAVMKMNKDWMQNIGGILILILLFMLLNVWAGRLGLGPL